jgi:hypothetical protein
MYSNGGNQDTCEIVYRSDQGLPNKTVQLRWRSIGRRLENLYNVALTIRVLGCYTKKVPRWFWWFLITVVEVSLISSLLIYLLHNNTDLA